VKILGFAYLTKQTPITSVFRFKRFPYSKFTGEETVLGYLNAQLVILNKNSTFINNCAFLCKVACLMLNFKTLCLLLLPAGDNFISVSVYALH